MIRALLAFVAALPVLATAPAARAGNLVIRLPVPDVAVGASLGQSRVDDSYDGASRGVSLRLRFGDHLELTGELGKATFGDERRTELSYGGGAYLHLGGLKRMSVFGGVAAGTGTVEQNSWYQADQYWAQAAVGLTVPLTRRIVISGELDVGRRRLRMTGDSVLLRDAALIYVPDREDYRQLRAGIALSF
jgi:hypothetical protein